MGLASAKLGKGLWEGCVGRVSVLGVCVLSSTSGLGRVSYLIRSETHAVRDRPRENIGQKKISEPHVYNSKPSAAVAIVALRRAHVYAACTKTKYS